MAHDRLVTVCSSCKRACCWRGLFFCDDYMSAGTEQLPVSELQRLDLEHSDYYAVDKNYPEPALTSRTERTERPGPEDADNDPDGMLDDGDPGEP